MTNVTTPKVHTLSTILGMLHAQAAAVGEATATAATVTVNVWFNDAPMACGEVSLAPLTDERKGGRLAAVGDSPDAWLGLPLRGTLFDLKDDEYAAACTLLETCAAEAVVVHLAALEASEPVKPISTIERICAEGRDVDDARRELLLIAIALGADDKILVAIREARRVSRTNTIVLPPGRYEHLSRGKGWARLGKGDNVTWGERTKGGYCVGPGKWAVGSNDGYKRKDSVPWTVKHIAVGAETWTVAS